MTFRSKISAGDAPVVAAVRFKLRRVLILYDGTASTIQDVLVARINSVNEQKRSKERWYRKLTSGGHRTHFRIGDLETHGTNGAEAYVDAGSVTVIPKNSVLRRTGRLDEAEMREVSRRLVDALAIDVGFDP